MVNHCRFLSVFIALALLCYPQIGLAEVVGDDGVTYESNEEYYEAQLQNTTEFTSKGGKNDSKKAKKKAYKQGYIGLVMGAAWAPSCYTSWASQCYYCCAAMLMSFRDARASFKAGKKAGRFNSGLTTSNIDNDPFDPNNDDPFDIADSDAINDIKKAEDQGYSVNDDTGAVTTPDGTVFKPADMHDPSKLEQLGLSNKDANTIIGDSKALQKDVLARQDELIKELIDKAKAKKGGSSETSRGIASTGGAGASGGRGGGLSGLGGETVILDEDDSDANRGKKTKGNRMPASEAAKLSKDFAGTPIGISMSDIFINMNRSYNSQKQQKTFFNKEY